VAWAEYFERQGVEYAFFSATDAVAALEQAEKHRLREAGEHEEEEEEEEDGEDHDEMYESGEEVEAEGNGLHEAVAETSLEDGEEDGWSTEGEGEDEMEDGETGKQLLNGESVLLRQVVQEVGARNGGSEEDSRTRVLTVAELEDLFAIAAPDLRGSYQLHPLEAANIFNRFRNTPRTQA